MYLFIFSQARDTTRAHIRMTFTARLVAPKRRRRREGRSLHHSSSSLHSFHQNPIDGLLFFSIVVDRYRLDRSVVLGRMPGGLTSRMTLRSDKYIRLVSKQDETPFPYTGACVCMCVCVCVIYVCTRAPDGVDGFLRSMISIEILLLLLVSAMLGNCYSFFFFNHGFATRQCDSLSPLRRTKRDE